MTSRTIKSIIEKFNANPHLEKCRIDEGQFFVDVTRLKNALHLKIVHKDTEDF